MNIEQIVGEIQAAFSELQESTQREIDQIKSKGHVDADVTAKIAEMGEKIAELESAKQQAEVAAEANKSSAKIAYDAAIKEFGEFIRGKSVNVTNGSDGAYAVPATIDRRIREVARNISPIDRFAARDTASSGDHSRIVVTSGISMEWVGETDARSTSTGPGLAKVAAVMGEGAAKTLITHSAIEDIFFDVESFVQEQIATSFALGSNAAFVDGNGTKKPKGLLDYTYVATADDSRVFGQCQHVLTGADADFVTFDESTGAHPGTCLINTVQSMAPKYRANARWFMNSATIGKVAGLKDGNGHLLYLPSLVQGVPGTLLGYPVIDTPDMPDIDSDTLAILFADLSSGYVVTDVPGTYMIRDPYSSDLGVLFKARKRIGGNILDSNAIKALKFAAA